MKRTKTQYCWRTGKECFDRRAQAERVAYRLNHRKHCTRRGAVYLCEYCGKYHVTHYTYEQCRRLEIHRRERKRFYMFYATLESNDTQTPEVQKTSDQLS